MDEERERLIALLVALILDGTITERDAEAIIDAYDLTGELPERWQLPLVLNEAIPANLDQLLQVALNRYVNRITASPDEAQDLFMNEAANLARELVSGAIDVATWHLRMRNLLINYLAYQAQTGAQGEISEDGFADLRENTFLQLVFLTRFADTVASNRLTPPQVVSRSQLYAGEGRAQWFRNNGLTNAQYGWVMDYLSLDDRNTCRPCSEAEARGPYLPGDPNMPLPGRICLGRGYCRCSLNLRYDVAAYVRLSGQAVVST